MMLNYNKKYTIKALKRVKFIEKRQNTLSKSP